MHKSVLTAATKEKKSDNSIRTSVEQKGKENSASALGTLLFCCSLNMYSFKCFAAELVDTEVLRDAYEANKFTYQPGAEELHRLMMSLEKI